MKGQLSAFFKKRWVDLVVILTLLFSIAAIFLFQYLPKESASLKAVIIREDDIIRVIDLSKLGEEEETYVIEGVESHMHIAAKHNAIRVTEADCPSQYCVNTGWITMPGRSIICLYNKVMINIESLDASMDVEI